MPLVDAPTIQLDESLMRGIANTFSTSRGLILIKVAILGAFGTLGNFNIGGDYMVKQLTAPWEGNLRMQQLNKNLGN